MNEQAQALETGVAPAPTIRDGHTFATAYDPNGNVTLATDGAGVTTQTAFDPDGNVTLSVANGYTSQQKFDGDDNLTASIDGDGDTTTNAYDKADQLTKVTDPDSNVTTYTLDGDGNTTLITNPNGYTTQQKFDGDGRITQAITPDGGTVNFTYDGDGRTTSDGNGTKTYNADGDIATASNSYGTYVFSYDKDDRVTLVTEPFSQSLNYAYDPAGNQTKVTDSQGGTESSTYDGDNYLTARSYVGQGQTLLVKYTNNEEGWNTTLSRYSDLAGTTLVATSKYQYDGAGNVTNVEDTGPAGAAIDQFAYALDGNGNLTSETDTQGGTPTTTDYSYDSAGQLTGAGGSSYGYDANGNLDTGSDTVTTGNEMTADANWDYKYDKEGELTEQDSTVAGSSEKWTYAWSANGNLDEVKHYNSAGTLVLDVTYEYDAFGEMIQKSDGTVVSRYAEDGWNSNMAAPLGNENMNTWAVLNGSNQWQERDIWGNQVGQELGRIVLSANNYTMYPMQDRQESVRDVIIANGTVDDSIAYDAFGNILPGETNSALRGMYAYTGRRLDIETDLQYNNARWYDPATGRWLSQDPLGFDAGDSNLYRYVNNQPTDYLDPSGQGAVFDRYSPLIKRALKDANAKSLDGINLELHSILAYATGEDKADAIKLLRLIPQNLPPPVNKQAWEQNAADSFAKIQARVGADIATKEIQLGTQNREIAKQQNGALKAGVAYGSLVPGIGWWPLLVQGFTGYDLGGNPLSDNQRRTLIGVSMLMFGGELVFFSAGCFPPETPVATESGLRPIGQVNPGERVWSYDFRSGTWRLCRVARRQDQEWTGAIHRIVTDRGQIRVTPNHPIWVVRGEDELETRRLCPEVERTEDTGGALAGRWVDACDVRNGDVIFLRGHGECVVRGVCNEHRCTRVCNLTVEDLHTFAVGEMQVLVHNTSGSPGNAPRPVSNLGGNPELGALIRQVSGNQTLTAAQKAAQLAEGAARIPGVTFERIPDVPGVEAVFRGVGERAPLLVVTREGQVLRGYAAEALIRDPAGSGGWRIVINRLSEVPQ